MAIPVDPVLERFCTWLFRQPGGVNNNAADDRTGQFITNNQQAQNPWLIPSTWGEIQTEIRRIVVPQGTQLYVVVASSHATDDERGGDTLENYAVWADSLFDDGVVSLAINGRAVKNLNTVKTNTFGVQFAATNPYVPKNGIAHLNQNMVSVARVHQFNPNDGDSFRIFSSAPVDNTHGTRGEPDYKVYVEYKIVRPPPAPPAPPAPS